MSASVFEKYCLAAPASTTTPSTPPKRPPRKRSNSNATGMASSTARRVGAAHILSAFGERALRHAQTDWRALGEEASLRTYEPSSLGAGGFFKELFVSPRYCKLRPAANDSRAPPVIDVCGETISSERRLRCSADAGVANVAAVVAAHLQKEEEVTGEEWLERMDSLCTSLAQRQLFRRVYAAVADARLGLATYTDAARRHVLLERQATVLRGVLTPVVVDPSLGRWLHALLLTHLPDVLLSAYLEMLRAAHQKLPAIIGRMVEPPADLEGAAKLACNDVSQFVRRPPVDPYQRDASTMQQPKAGGNSKLVPLDNCHFLVVSPVVSFKDSPSVEAPLRYQQFRNCIQNLAGGKQLCQEISLSISEEASKDVYDVIETMVAAVKTKVQELKKKHKSTPPNVILVGWEMSGSLICKVALEVAVSAVICLAFPNLTMEGPRGDLDDEITQLSCPSLFVVGDKSTLCDVNDLQDMRDNMLKPETTGVVVVGEADEALKVSTRKLLQMNLTQSVVDRLVTEQIREFVVNYVCAGATNLPITSSILSTPTVNTSTSSGITFAQSLDVGKPTKQTADKTDVPRAASSTVTSSGGSDRSSASERLRRLEEDMDAIKRDTSELVGAVVQEFKEQEKADLQNQQQQQSVQTSGRKMVAQSFSFASTAGIPPSHYKRKPIGDLFAFRPPTAKVMKTSKPLSHWPATLTTGQPITSGEPSTSSGDGQTDRHTEWVMGPPPQLSQQQLMPPPPPPQLLLQQQQQAATTRVGFTRVSQTTSGVPMYASYHHPQPQHISYQRMGVPVQQLFDFDGASLRSVSGGSISSSAGGGQPMSPTFESPLTRVFTNRPRGTSTVSRVFHTAGQYQMVPPPGGSVLVRSGQWRRASGRRGVAGQRGGSTRGGGGAPAQSMVAPAPVRQRTNTRLLRAVEPRRVLVGSAGVATTSSAHVSTVRAAYQGLTMSSAGNVVRCVPMSARMSGAANIRGGPPPQQQQQQATAPNNNNYSVYVARPPNNKYMSAPYK